MLWMGKHKFRHLELVPGGKMIGLEVKPPTTDFFVDGTLGDDGNTGLAWGTGYALATIQEAFDRVTARGAERGRCRIFVAPGGYTEDLTSPTNAIAPFGQLIAWSATDRARGSVYLASATATEPILTLKARGWRIEGFEFDAPSTDGCILLDTTAKYAEIANCLFVGNTGVATFGINANFAADLLVVRDSMFIGFGGWAITQTAGHLMFPEIMRCFFYNNAKHIAPQSTLGMDGGWIHDCHFNKVGNDHNASVQIDTRGGSQNLIGPNNILSSTYDNAGGYYSSATDMWRGNACEDAYQAARPQA